MTVTSHLDGSSPVVSIDGAVDAGRSDEIEDQIKREVARVERTASGEVVLDVGEVSTADADGLRAVHRAFGGTKPVTLRNVTPEVSRIVESLPSLFTTEEVASADVDPESPARTVLFPDEPAVEPNEPA